MGNLRANARKEFQSMQLLQHKKVTKNHGEPAFVTQCHSGAMWRIAREPRCHCVAIAAADVSP
jgi:hypothetical protein